MTWTVAAKVVLFNTTGMENLSCIIHYDIKDARYSNIKPLSEVNKERIQAAKNLRESKGGLNYHKQQCDSVPEQFDSSLPGIHLDPCYKKFTLILSQEKKGSSSCPSTPETNSQSSSRTRRALNATPSSSNVYPI